MKTVDYTYDLPTELIAQQPSQQREDSRLMVLSKDGGFKHQRFVNVVDYIHPGDLLILNDSKVLPVKLTGTEGAGKVRDILIVRQLDDRSYQILTKGRYTGRILISDDFYVEVSSGSKGVFYSKGSVLHGADLNDKLWESGHMPLPPYIERPSSDTDKERYQTVYARHCGSIAAPTAGLHFTHDILEAIKNKGVTIKTITLHVGTGTFRPITSDELPGHKMEEECFEIDTHLGELIQTVKASGNRVVVVGTTSTRAVEAYMSGRYKLTEYVNGHIKATTDLFITPGFRFKAVDVLLTNLHMPRCTPLVLVCAFAGRQCILNAYKEAVAKEYRFLSYGDAMLIT
ncbi:MAG: tRNA preQ1(34) S-adenosylmethionine ribosyltransferase-isomerase QueA [Nitrospirae bacterium]|nr:tRNA preQ1(34) S-adenosylmethionine ribosyltransferase-isomerase QueA [Nitrospirota bacterium]